MKYDLFVGTVESSDRDSFDRRSKGFVLVAAIDPGNEKIITMEKIHKHPFLLRIRVRLAARRIKVRLRKIGKVKAALGIA